MEAEGEEVYRPTPEQEAELEEALREIDRGEVASEEEVRSAFRPLTRLSFSSRAAQQVDHIYRYIARDNADAA